MRDGGLRAVVIRLGRGFNSIDISGDRVTAGAAALDAHVARRAADTGLDLTFLRTIPGSIGGAVRMNAGCYGSYTADHFISAQAVTRAGAFAVVLEKVPQALADQITETVAIPTIGIGASAQCDGQILVVDDMLGLFTAFKAKFVKRYAHLGDDAKAAVQAYADEVTARSFPGPEHVFSDEVSKT